MAAQQGAEPELGSDAEAEAAQLLPEPELVILVSAEGDQFEVVETVALVSPTIARMIGDGRRVCLPSIPSKILGKVIDFAEKLADSRAAAAAAAAAAAGVAGDTKANYEVDLSWGKDLVRVVDPTTLTKLILAATYLEMEELLHLSCERAAQIMVGRTPEEVQKMFSLKCVVTPAQEAKIRAKNQWAFE